MKPKHGKNRADLRLPASTTGDLRQRRPPSKADPAMAPQIDHLHHQRVHLQQVTIDRSVWQLQSQRPTHPDLGRIVVPKSPDLEPFVASNKSRHPLDSRLPSAPFSVSTSINGSNASSYDPEARHTIDDKLQQRLQQ
ncbi:hypothetical protein ACLOJK_038568 [Asimina triloba]